MKYRNIGDLLLDEWYSKLPFRHIWTSGNSSILEMILKDRHNSSMFGEGAPEDLWNHYKQL